MTKREGAIITAHTGTLSTEFSNFHKYAEELLKRSVFTHEFATRGIWTELKEASYKEFIEVIKNQN